VLVAEGANGAVAAPSGAVNPRARTQEAPQEAPLAQMDSEEGEMPPQEKPDGNVNSAVEAARAWSRKRLGR